MNSPKGILDSIATEAAESLAVQTPAAAASTTSPEYFACAYPACPGFLAPMHKAGQCPFCGGALWEVRPASVTNETLVPPSGAAPLPAQSPPAHWTDENFHESFDARVWAEAFVRIAKASGDVAAFASDEGTMLAWFANAIMRGYDDARKLDPAPAQSETPPATLAVRLRQALAELRKITPDSYMPSITQAEIVAAELERSPRSGASPQREPAPVLTMHDRGVNPDWPLPNGGAVPAQPLTERADRPPLHLRYAHLAARHRTLAHKARIWRKQIHELQRALQTTNAAWRHTSTLWADLQSEREMLHSEVARLARENAALRDHPALTFLRA